MIDIISFFMALGVVLGVEIYFGFKESKGRKQREFEDKIFKEMLLNRLYDISVSMDYCSGRRPLRKEDVIK